MHDWKSWRGIGRRPRREFSSGAGRKAGAGGEGNSRGPRRLCGSGGGWGAGARRQRGCSQRRARWVGGTRGSSGRGVVEYWRDGGMECGVGSDLAKFGMRSLE